MNMLRFLSLLCVALPLSALKPGPRGAPVGMMPQVSPEQYQQMMTEVDQYLSSLGEEDINKMVQEAMKDPGFQQFVKDVEEGKITPEDIFGPGQAPGTPPPAPTPQTPKPATPPTPEPVAEKPQAVVLRSPAAALEMLKLLIATINERLIPKAEGYHRVADVVRPWYKRLNTLTYYLSTLLQPEHIQQLVTDKAFLALHDALQKMSEKLNFWEPKVQVQEFGEEEMAPAVKEQSKKALSEVLHILQNAFEAQQIITGLEQLFKKYEPEIVKRRKAVEELEENARKSAESSKYQRMSPARVEREGRYARPTPSFYDWLYEQPETPRSEYRGYDEGRPSSRGSDSARPSTTGGGGKAPSAQPKKEDGEKKATEDKKKQEAYKPGKAVKAEMPSHLEYGLDEIERSAELIHKNLADNFEGAFPPHFGGLAPSYVNNTMDAREPARVAPGPRRAGPAPSTNAFTDLQLKKIGTFNKVMKDITHALHRLQSKRGEVEYAIGKISDAKTKQQAAKRLAAALEKNKKALHSMYNATLALAEKAGKPGSLFRSWPQLVLHYGVPLNSETAKMFNMREGTKATAVIPEFQLAYELVYGGDKATRERLLKILENRIKAPAGAADAKHGAAEKAEKDGKAAAAGGRVPPPLPPLPARRGPVPGPAVFPGGAGAAAG